MKDFLAESRSFYDLYFRSKFGSPIGCTEDDIRDLENSYGCQFPASYQQFLLWMGKDHKGVFRGSEWFLKDIVDNTECLPDFLEENEVDFSHKSKAICFFSHQGYMSAWFYPAEKEPDPNCFFFSESFPDNAVKENILFSKFLLTELKQLKS